MAVGKSTVGRALAGRLNVDFVDLDEVVGAPSGWFARGGEAAFRTAETVALTSVASGAGVLALGGGTLVSEANRRLLEGWTVVVLLATESTLEARLGAGTGRPLAPRWRDLLQERAPLWRRYGAPIWTDSLDTASVVEEVLRRCRS